MNSDEIEAVVIEALDNAKENGERICVDHYAVVAFDLIECCADLEGTPASHLFEAIKAWQKRNIK